MRHHADASCQRQFRTQCKLVLWTSAARGRPADTYSNTVPTGKPRTRGLQKGQGGKGSPLDTTHHTACPKHTRYVTVRWCLSEQEDSVEAWASMTHAPAGRVAWWVQVQVMARPGQGVPVWL